MQRHDAHDRRSVGGDQKLFIGMGEELSYPSPDERLRPGIAKGSQ
ncbi:hypothetical protein AvCA_00710 [Azotobacter vinelandii CA]|uniref:Uncharacterized protein n=2 Tax=Azotobacter vinelandii TaxID=354 RepID=C1DG11_AZOVD|nr:hypothetical protein Avin_00710 [Azotobacter vinelandii DJ]AGK15705.1 hypothetical protein AvCA_00710 [Azotobacter vinelandii CA]AGK19050.1 hypothetical protein AvCA6_00710 [Azotobacter vinelandii CA6]